MTIPLENVHFVIFSEQKSNADLCRVDKFSKNVAVQSNDCTTSMSINRKTVAIKTTGRQRIIADHVTINVKVVFYNSNRR